MPQSYDETQMRVNLSNQVGYWDSIVDNVSGRQKKGSLTIFLVKKNFLPGNGATTRGLIQSDNIDTFHAHALALKAGTSLWLFFHITKKSPSVQMRATKTIPAALLKDIPTPSWHDRPTFIISKPHLQQDQQMDVDELGDEDEYDLSPPLSTEPSQS
ncbi:hypothetical protein BDW67DRAFT_179620 [Aspergillus spinulosporus]